MPAIFQEVRVSTVPDYQVTLEVIPRGNDRDYKWTVSPLPTGQTLTDAWFRVDNAISGAQLFEKHITPSLVAGQGQIEDIGTGTGIAIIRFQVTQADTLLCSGGDPDTPTDHPFGTQVKTSAGKINEFEQGVLPVIEQVVVSA